jgi:hypothetical protein
MERWRDDPVSGNRYFSAVETDPNVVLRLVPVPLSPAMMATPIPDAIRPYSMAVAPDSSLKKGYQSLTHYPALQCFSIHPLIGHRL